MIFSIVILLLIGLVAFFNYLQGLFSATLSAIIAVFSAVLAVSYHETIVETVFKSKMSDEASAISLCLLFALSYIILRVIFDSAVPGNLRVPVLADKVGSGIMGIIAALYSVGIFAIAAQTMPFGPSIAGYSRYDLNSTRDITIPGNRGGQMQDAVVNDELKPTNLDTENERGLFIPVDDLVLVTVRHLSDGGALAGSNSYSAVHPDYLQEMFGDRLGMQVGSKRTALTIAPANEAHLQGLFAVPAIATADGELKEVRDKPLTLTTKPQSVLLIARISIDSSAADDIDRIFRFSTGAIRIVANGKNYFPIGIVEIIDNNPLLFLQKPDDFLFLDMGSSKTSFDAAFYIDKTDLYGDSKGDEKIPDGRFLEVKRLAQIDLSGKQVTNGYTPAADSGLLRKKTLLDEIAAAPRQNVSVPSASATPVPTPTVSARPRHQQAVATPAGTPAPAEATGTAPGAHVTPEVNFKIGVNTSDGEAQNVTVVGGTVSLKDSGLAVVTIDPVDSLDKLAAGDSQLSELYVPDGKKLVQIPARPDTNVKLIDTSNNSYSPSGVYATASANGKTGLFMRYNALALPATLDIPAGALPTATYLFLVPSSTQLKQLQVGAQTLSVDLTVP